MADVTVSDLAKSVGASVDRLLGQMKDAGLSHVTAGDVVSDVEKKTLLAYLKASHGEQDDAPKKITLKRKTTSTLKVGTGSSRKTVNVEVRKKRTYVKRNVTEEPAGPADVVERTAPEPAVFTKSTLVDDVEQKRQAALESRRQAEAEEKNRQQALEEDKKQKEQAASAKPKPAVAPQGDAQQAKSDDDRSKHAKKKDRHHVGADAEKDDAPRKTKTVRKNLGPKKAGHKVDISRLSDDYEEEEVVRPRTHRAGRANKHGFKKPTEKVVLNVDIIEGMTASELAGKMRIKANMLVKELIKLGVMATINQSLDQETAQLVVEELGHKPVLVSSNAMEEKLQQDLEVSGERVSRAPVVTVMGHVDHGKTSLLDYIRKSKVASGEAGGITQHIGAYRVTTALGEITFLDTPGHAAFTAMRARGAQATDIVILVVAADDGVMPQTEEAIQHARAAGVPLVVAVNKCDKEAADPDRVKNELAAKDVIPEDWGGDVQFINVSAHTGEGIDRLLESVSLQAELLELTAVTDAAAKGVVVESRVEKGRGIVATVLVQSGTLSQGNILLAGKSYGRVRAMSNERGQQVTSAGPSTPVELLGLDSTPDAGDEFVVVPDERRAREVAEHREERERQERLKRQQVVSLETMFADAGANEKKVLPVVIKTDVRGSLEAINGALAEMGNDEVQINVVSSGVGGITGNDVNLALTSNAIIIGFNVRADASARTIAESEAVEIRYYSVIYQLLDEVKRALEGMLDPERVESIVGIADVRDVFRSPKFGQVAGCMVIEGTVYRSKPIRVLRDNVVIYEGELESLRRFKDDVADVRNGMECGIGVKDYDVKVGDQIEVYEVTEVKRAL
ncbi:MAG: translation initiation factor IF-2 [Cellvibrionaceae bacterium]|nr:translation initiation factor IF-2 [Cellvibrionaceae bacterium]